MKKGAELALNFMLRLVFGMIAICLINGYLQEKGLDACVGINALSALTSGFLGLPGVALLYGVRVYLMWSKYIKIAYQVCQNVTSNI